LFLNLVGWKYRVASVIRDVPIETADLKFARECESGAV
jgi:hypothetical protein